MCFSYAATDTPVLRDISLAIPVVLQLVLSDGAIKALCGYPRLA